jgi:hypothetical protein
MDEVGRKILADLKGYESFNTALTEFKADLKAYREDQFSSWARDIHSSKEDLR